MDPTVLHRTSRRSLRIWFVLAFIGVLHVLLPIAQASDDTSEERLVRERANRLLTEGRYNHHMGLNGYAYDQLSVALQLFDQELGDLEGVAETLAALGDMYAQHGNLEGAVQRYHAAYRLYSSVKSERAIDVAWRGFLLYAQLENVEAASRWLPLLKPDWLSTEDIDDNLKREQIAAEIAVASLTKNALQVQALLLAAAPLLIAKDKTDVEAVQIFWLFHYVSEVRDTIELRNSIIEVAQHIGDPFLQATAWLGASSTAEHRGASAESWFAAVQAARLIEPLEDPLLQFRVHYRLGEIADSMGALADAELHYQYAMAELERIRSGVPGETERALFFAWTGDVYSRLIDVLRRLDADPSFDKEVDAEWYAKTALFTGHADNAPDMVGGRNRGVNPHPHRSEAMAALTLDYADLRKTRALLDIWAADTPQTSSEREHLAERIRGLASHPQLHAQTPALVHLADQVAAVGPILPLADTKSALDLLHEVRREAHAGQDLERELNAIAAIVAPQFDPVVSEDAGARAREDLSLLPEGVPYYHRLYARKPDQRARPNQLAIQYTEQLSANMIAYHVGDQDTLAWVILPQGEQRIRGPFSTGLSADDLSERIQLVRNRISHGFFDARPELLEPLRTLGEALIAKPLREAGVNMFDQSETGRLLIVPDLVLHMLPFQALRVGNTPQEPDRFLIELFDISYAPSIRLMFPDTSRFRVNGALDLARMLDNTVIPLSAKGRLLAVTSDKSYSDPRRGLILPSIPYARQEGTDIQDIWSSKGDVSVLNEPSNVSLETLFDAHILHFATHAVSDVSDSLQSFLLLAPGQTGHQNVLLTAQQVLAMRGRLTTRLAVLSACTTVGEADIPGEGIMGLTWAFLAAGVPTVIATQWPLNDTSAVQFAVHFYRNLAEGTPPAAALSRTQRAMIADGGFRISQWAAYVTVGWPGQLLKSQKQVDAAAAESEAALVLEEGSARSSDYLGSLLVEKGALALAADQFKVAITRDPQWIDPYLHLAGLLLFAADPVGAQSVIQQAVSRGLHDGRLEHLMALSLLAQRQPILALQHLDTAAEMRPEDPLIALDRSNAFHVLGRLDEAAHEAERAVSLSPQQPDSHVQLGNVYAGRHQTEMAKGEYEAALKLDPKHANALYNLGLLYVTQLYQLEEGRALFEQAVNANGAHLPARYNLILACIRLQDKPCAEKQLVLARSAGSDNTDYQRRLDNLEQELSRLP
jgi:CHAT domain-containing protein/Tfp pilus assembly protein PilF